MAKEIAEEARGNGDEGNGEVAVREAGTTEVRAPRPAERFAEYAQNRAAIEADLVAKELTTSQIDAIMTAATPEELDAAMKLLGVVGLREFDNGVEFRINGFHYAPGTREDFRNSLGVFAVIEATMLETGETAYIDTGVERVIAYLRGCELMERFPLDVRVVKQDTGRGNAMITLQPIPKRVTTP